MMRIWSCIIAWVCCVLLTGCWGWSSDSETTITLWANDWIIATIPEGFEEIPSTLVENRQITNQILYSWRQPLSEEQIEDWATYTLNLIISQSAISTWVTYDQFAQVNMEKMQQYMIGFEKGETSLETFDCGENEISWVQSIFTVNDDYYQSWGAYRFYQYQFVYDNQWYIISLSSLPHESRTLRRTFKNILDSLECS